jgi:hypothetical protein
MLTLLAEFDLDLYKKRVDFTIRWLCDAAEEGSDDIYPLAKEAHRAVLELAEELDVASTDDLRTMAKLESARRSVGELLDTLEVLVYGKDRAVISCA